MIQIETTDAPENPKTTKKQTDKGKTAKTAVAQFFDDKLQFPFGQNTPSDNHPLARDEALLRARRMTHPPLGLRVRSPKIFSGERIGIPLPPSHAAAAPAWSVSRAAAWLRVLPGLRPPPPAIVLRSLRGAAAAAAMFASRAARRRRPVHRRALRGRGVSSLGSLTLASGLPWARAMRPPAWVCLQACHAPRLVLGAKSAPPAWVCRCPAAAPCLVLGASRPAPLSSANVPPAAACSRFAVCNFVVCACIMQPLLQKHIKSISKLHQKAPKSPLFVRQYAASAPVCVN